MAAAAICNNRKIAISRPQFKRFRRNLAHSCTSTFLTFLTIKNLKFLKSKMAAAAILKKSKSLSIPAFVRAISTKFGTAMQFDPLDHSDR